MNEIQNIEGKIVTIYERNSHEVMVRFADEKHSGRKRDLNMYVHDKEDYDLCYTAHRENRPLCFRARVVGRGLELVGRLSLTQNKEDSK